MSLTDDIIAFHKKYKQEYNGKIRKLPKELDWLIKFKEEELKEYKRAVKSGNLIKQYDALLDLMYVILGTMYLQGLPFPSGWRCVHESNMTKQVVPMSKGKYGKTRVAKGKHYVKPNLQFVIDMFDTAPNPFNY